MEDRIEVQVNEAVQGISKLISIVSSLKAQVDNLGQSNGFNNVNKQIKQTLSVGDAIKKVFNFSAIYYTGKRAIKILQDMTDESVDFVEQTNLFNVSFGKGLQGLNQYYEKAVNFQEKLEEKLGVNISESMKYQALFNSISKSMGISAEHSYTLSENLTKLGYDLSSLYNADPSKAMGKLQSGILTGQTKPLRDFGIDITQGTLQTELDRLGIDRNISQLSQAEKVIIRYISALRQAQIAHGDFANTMDSPANQLRIFNAQVTAFKRNMGNLWQGFLGGILPYINAIMMVINELLKMTAKLFGFEILEQDVNISANVGADDLADDLGNASKKAKELKAQLMGFDEINNIALPDKSSSGSGSGVSGTGIDQRLLDAMKEYDNLMDKVKNKATDIRDKMMEWLGFHRTDDGWKLNEGLTNAEKILDTMKLIGIAIGTWKASKIITNLMKNLGILNKTQAFQWAFGFTLTLTGIFAQYKGTQHLLDGDVDIFTLLETFLGTAAGTWGIVSILKATKFGKALSLGKQIKIGLGVMLSLQGLQVIDDGIKEGDVKKQILGSLGLGGGTFLGVSSIAGWQVALPIAVAVTITTVLTKKVKQQIDDTFSEVDKLMQDNYEIFQNSAKSALDPNNSWSIEDYNNYTKTYKDIWTEPKKNIEALNAMMGIFGPKFDSKEIDDTIEKYRNLAFASVQLFDNGGQSIQNYYNHYKNLVDEIIGSSDTWNDLYNTYINNKNAVKSSNDELEILLSKLGSSAYKTTAEDIKKLNSTLDTMASYVKASGDAFVDATVASTNKLKEEGKISQETADLVVANAIRKAEAEGNAFETYQLKLKDYATQLEKGMITQEEYNVAIANTKTEYEKLTAVADSTATAVEDLTSNMSKKIDLGDWNTAKTYAEKLGSLYTDNLDKVNENYDATKKFYDDQITWTEKALSNAKNLYGTESQQYKDIEKELNALKETRTGATKQYEDDVKKLKATVGKSLKVLEQQLIDSGYDIEKDAEGLYKAIQDQLNAIGEDTEVPENLDELNKDVNKKYKYLSSMTQGFSSDLREIYLRTGQKISKAEKDELNKRIATTADKLVEQTNTVKELTKDQVEAWKLLAENSEDVYNEKISQVDEDTRLALEAILGKVDTNSQDYINKWAKMANESSERYNNALSNLPEDTRAKILASTMAVTGMTDATRIAYQNLSSTGKKAFNNAMSSLDSDASKKVQSVINEINKKSDNMSISGNNFAQKFANPLRNGNTFFSAGYEMVKSAVKGAKDGNNYNGGTSQIGYWFVEGFKSKLKSAGSAMFSAGFSMVQSALNGGNSAQRTGSPAKETIKMGNFFTEGYIIGLKKKQEEVKEVSSNLVGTALKEINSFNSNGITINPNDFVIDTNQFIDYGQISGAIATYSNVNLDSNIDERIENAIYRGLSNATIPVEIEATTDEGIIFKKVQAKAREYVMQTGTTPFPA